jgi:3D-(3,5/4)-trihydroxycyclohexane-1,2-dione acylhydrolase (decyclizing)
MRLTTAQATIKFLSQQFVERDQKQYKFINGVWGIFGHGNVAGLGEALEQNKDLKHFLPRNEQGMVHSAVAYAKQNKRLKTFACTSSIGPGATNMVTAAAGATINRLPVLLLPGDIFSRRNVGPVLQQLEHNNSFDISVNDCFRPISVFWDRINRPEQIISSLNEAMRVLTDPSLTGAVTISLPQDVQAEAYNYPINFFEKRVWSIPRDLPSDSSLVRATEYIKKAKRPIVIAGGGVIYSDAEKKLKQFCDATGVPVVETQAGKGALHWDHPQNLGAVGVTGTSAANAIAGKSDLIICIGTRLSDFTTASKTIFQNLRVRFLSINVSSFDAHKHSSFALIGDARECIAQINERLKIDNFTISKDYKSEINNLKKEWNLEVDRIFGLDNFPLISQGEVIGIVSNFMKEEDTVVGAAGSLPGDMHKLWRTENGSQYHMEYGYSCMGYEIAGGLGIKMAKEKGDVFVMVGDGSYLMMNSEIVTAVQEGQKLIIILINNHGFGSINNLSISLGSEGFGNQYKIKEESTDDYTGEKIHVDYSEHARSMGIDAIKVQTRNELDDALASSRENLNSMLIEILVDVEVRVPGYDAWWDVPVAEISKSDKVTRIRKEYEEQLKKERDH